VKKRKIELLSPARDLECGIAAIDHGADAVYIGGPKFGARTAVGNSIEDIARLVEYAHLFGSRVYLALNTILFDHELDEAVKLTWDAYHSGIDALIIQDMGLLECDLPPLHLHASTQTNNQTPEKVVFLEKVGFQQIVLARELTLQQICEINAQTSAVLEFFVHGSLCVCYSGQCYMSHYATGRSGNRGDCTQMCRHQYTLTDYQGKIIEKDKYLLSLKDLNLTQNIEQLIDAGISSFKIEGRLKGPEYVKNITAHYRKEIDAILVNRPDLRTSSCGISFPAFGPNPEKSFNRFFTSYNLGPDNTNLSNILTPKSMGQKIGKVIRSDNGSIIFDSLFSIENGDGLCFFDKNGVLNGFRVNKVEGNKIFPMPKMKIKPNTILYRNKDVGFENEVEKSRSCRKIGVKMTLDETKEGIVLQLFDDEGYVVKLDTKINKEHAKEPEKQVQLIKDQLSKIGNYIFRADFIAIHFNKPLFIPGKVLSELKRKAFDELTKKRLAQYIREEIKIEPNSYPYHQKKVSYEENISNNKAEQFYRRHGFTNFTKAYELQAKMPCQLLMTTKHCIRKELDLCLLCNPGGSAQKNNSLFIEDNTGKYQIEFDCKRCEMKIYST
jgi:collagenase-like PrtC family protease